MNEESRDDEKLIKTIREALDQQTAGQDGAIRARLAQARHQALAELPAAGARPSWRPAGWRWPALAVTSLAALLLIFAFHSTVPHQQLVNVLIDEPDILSAEADPDFYADLDFYLWLAEQQGNAG